MIAPETGDVLWGLEEGAKHRRPPILEVDIPLQPPLQKSLDSLLRFRPRKRSLKGGEGIEEPIRGR